MSVISTCGRYRFFRMGGFMLDRYITIQDGKRYRIFLYSGFGLLLALFVSIAVFHFEQVLKSNDKLNEAIENNDVQLRAAMNMRVAVRERAILLWHMTFQKDIFERDELYQQFNLYGARFGHARESYLSTKQSERELELFERLQVETNKRAPQLRIYADLLMKGSDEKTYFSQLDTALTEQVKISDVLDQLIRLQQEQNERAHLETAGEIADTLSDLIIWIIIIILAVTLFARIVTQVAEKQSQELAWVNEELIQLARHDHLTSLPNRLFLSEHLPLTLSHSLRHGKRGALLYIDLDDFKPINDRYGHNAGDIYLQSISLAIKDLLRDSDVLVRLGGDEFVVVLYEIAAEHDAIVVAEKLLKALSEDYRLEGNIVSASASIGICFFPEESMTVDSLLTAADTAMYKAKEAGKNQYFIHR